MKVQQRTTGLMADIVINKTDGLDTAKFVRDLDAAVAFCFRKKEGGKEDDDGWVFRGFGHIAGFSSQPHHPFSASAELSSSSSNTSPFGLDRRKGSASPFRGSQRTGEGPLRPTNGSQPHSGRTNGNA